MARSLSTHRHPNRPRLRRLFLEQLEDRSLLSAVITVNSTIDNNVRDQFLTLREAILINNRALDIAALTSLEQLQVTGTPTSTDKDTIAFNIPGSGVKTINLTSALPTITDSVVIDGYTQPGSKPNESATTNNAVLLIELNGSQTGPGINGLSIDAGGSTVRGLAINHFLGNGAVDLTGAIFLAGGGGNVIEGNFLGTDVAGQAATGNLRGVMIRGSSDNKIGGQTTAARNVISGNTHIGVDIVAPASGNVVQGNFIGTDATGAKALGNAVVGVFINGTDNNTIGGTAPEARNVISGNLVQGISIAGGAGATGNVVQGNYIGTDASGTRALGNTTGVNISQGAASNTIGGSSGKGNLISGNTGDGITITGFETSQNLVAGNIIGTDVSGTQALGNGGSGVVTDSANNTIGGQATGAGNRIAFNGGSGLAVIGLTGNAILSNAIFSNTGLGIDLGDDGVTPNDPGDADDGPNNLQNFPEISAATLNAGMLTITYRVPSDPVISSYPLRIEFFEADSDGQEGQTFLGFDTYTAAEAGTTKTITFQPATPVALGELLVATATDTGSFGGNSSEFSPNEPARPPNQPPQIVSNGGGDAASLNVPENSVAVTTVVAVDPDSGVPPTYKISGGADAARFSIDPASGVLMFVTAPNFEQPADAGGNNVFDVIVQASDSQLTDTQVLTVTVTNVNEAPTITSNGGGAAAGFSVPENTTAVTDVEAIDPDAGTTLFFNIAGGPDAGRFTIDPASGVLIFLTAPNFEQPTDAGGNNIYEVVVRASDGSLVATQALAVTVTNVNEPPTITSNGGGSAAGVSIPENSAAVTAVEAVDPDAVTTLAYSISGQDSGLFTIDPSTGFLAFKSAPNFEQPADAGGNNVYDLVVQASDGSLSDTQNLAVTVTDVNESSAVTVVVNDFYPLLEDKPLIVQAAGVLANDIGAGGNPLSAALIAGPTHGKIQLQTTGGFVYTPAPDYAGPDHFIYGATTSKENLATFAVTWNFDSKKQRGKFYRFAPNSAVASLVGELVPPPKTKGDLQPMGLAITPLGKLYLLTASYLMEVDPNTGALRTIGRQSLVGTSEGDLTYNPADGQLYACGGSRDSLIRIDPATGVRTLVGPMGSIARDVSGLAFTPDGTLYGVALRDGAPDFLVKIDASTGVATAIGPTGTNETIRVLAGLAYDPGAGGLRMALGSTLFAINPTTGAATPIGDLISALNGKAVGYVSGLAIQGPPLAIGTVAVNVGAVNDAPSFLKGPDQGAANDSGPFTAPAWATAISPGPANEAEQQLNFVLTTTETQLFSAQPAADRFGTLTFTPAPGAVGTATVQVVLHDDGGTSQGGSDASPPQTFTITIAPPPGPPGAWLNQGVLQIVGTAEADDLKISLSSNVVHVSGKLGSAQVSQSYPLGAVQRLAAYLGNGDDRLGVSTGIRVPLVVDAGAGNDTIMAGGGPAVLIGGEGNDVLIGGGRRDVLIGGAGADQLFGNAGNDLLIAGTTAFDAKASALLAIQQEWTSSRTLSQRMANLRAGSGPALAPLGVKVVQDQTVFDDADVDTLLGGENLDWFFADLAMDKVRDRALSERIG